MRRPLVVLGSGGLAREVALAAFDSDSDHSRWDFLGYISHDPTETGKELRFGKVLGDDTWFLDQGITADILMGIGYPQVRKAVLQRYLSFPEQYSFPNLIHPRAYVNPELVAMGQGNVFSVGSVFTCDIVVGDFNHFNWNATIGHDARFGSYNVVNPGANVSGNVVIADEVLIGTGCQILEGRSVGANAVLGAGSLVRANVSAGTTVVGVPAKPLARH